MITRLRVRNFKKLDDIDIELGNAVVLVGPNNSGKTAALQALALWNTGLRKWNEKRKGKAAPESRPGVTINRLDLISIPVSQANLLWRDLHVISRKAGQSKENQFVFIEIIVDGISGGVAWECGFEFYYANPESFYCRPLRLERSGDGKASMPVAEEAADVKMAFLPPMSGLAGSEVRLEQGAINVRIGEGRTAEVLRNLCLRIHERDDNGGLWDALVREMQALFGIALLPPRYIEERSEIEMHYGEPNGTVLDLASAGRGLQQTLLLLAYLYQNPATVLLLDEPDAHLEILRQRQIYQIITDIARAQDSQIIAASHSEVLLAEAADRDLVVAFIGKPHRIDDRGSQLLKSLKDIGFQDYYQADVTGWVLYLEGSTDLAILRALSERLGHEARRYLERPFVHYVGNDVPRVWSHFHGLREACENLVGIAVFDRLPKGCPEHEGPVALQWRKREIENYVCSEDNLLLYARGDGAMDLFATAARAEREAAMRSSIEEVSRALKTLGKPDPWSDDIKASDDFLDPLFQAYYTRLGLPNVMNKTSYYELARVIPEESIDDEIVTKLDAIVEIAKSAKTRTAQPESEA